MFLKNCVIKIKYENYRFDFLFFFLVLLKMCFLKRKTEENGISILMLLLQIWKNVRKSL